MSNPDVELRCRSSFEKQQFMDTLGARLTAVRPGEVVIELPFGAHLTQQHGFVHAGAVTTIADTACGYAALTLMPEGAAVLSVEFKINLMRPAIGTTFRATGKVLKSGKSLTVCSGIVEAMHESRWTTTAAMQATMMAIVDRKGLKD